MERKKFPVSFKFVLLLFFLSLQCFLGALYLKERENYYRLESQAPGSVRPEMAAMPSGIAGKTQAETEQGSVPEKAETPQPLLQAPSYEKATVAVPAVSPAPIQALDIKKKGTLWLDKSKDKYVITLGMKNGLKEGDILKIYDYDKVIGKVKVVNTMDKLSIVEIDEADRQNLTKTYYKVSLE